MLSLPSCCHSERLRWQLGHPPRHFQLRDTIQANKHSHQIVCYRKVSLRGCCDYRGRHLAWLPRAPTCPLGQCQGTAHTVLFPGDTHRPQAATQSEHWGFNASDMMMMTQAAGWGEKQQNWAACHPQAGAVISHLQRVTRALLSHLAFISLVILPAHIQAGGLIASLHGALLSSLPSCLSAGLREGAGRLFCEDFAPIPTF